jgi:hypothetical protein
MTTSQKINVKFADRDNQLANILDYDVSNLIFSDPVEGKVPGNDKLKYFRVTISNRNPDGSIGDLILPTERLFCFGVKESDLTNDDGKSTGHSMSLCLWNKDGATEEEKLWVENFTKICEKCKEHIWAIRKEVGKKAIVESDLNKVNPLYWKTDENNNRIPGVGPILSVKLIETRKKDKKGEEKKEDGDFDVKTMFFDPQGKVLSLPSILGKYCYTKAALKVESVFVGSKISLQIKVYEAEIELIGNTMKPLLSRQKAIGRVLGGTATNMNEVKVAVGDHDNNEKEGSVHDSDDGKEEPKVEPKAEIKPIKVVKKVVKAKAK